MRLEDPHFSYLAKGMPTTMLQMKSKELLDGVDTNHLICVLENRFVNEQEFFYKFKLDEDDYLVSFFWRDSPFVERFRQLGAENILTSQLNPLSNASTI